MKPCKVCQEFLPLSCFYQDKRRKDGHFSVCKWCWNFKCRKYYKEHLQQCRDRMRDYKRRPEIREMYKIKAIARQETRDAQNQRK